MKKDTDSQASLDEAVNRYVKSVVGFALSKRSAMILVLLFFALIFVLALGVKSDVDLSAGSGEVERKLAKIISNIEGVESAEVMITYESTSQKVPATSESISSGIGAIGENTDNNSVSRLVQGSGGNTLIITELEPEIRGVVVVAKGADDYMVKIDIIDAVKTVLNISGDKVEVLNMK